MFKMAGAEEKKVTVDVIDEEHIEVLNYEIENLKIA